jgi:hypothetical protein
MELDARLLITLAGMIASVVASFVLTRAKCVELEEDIKTIIKRLNHLDNDLDKNNTATQISEQRVSVLSKMLDPQSGKYCTDLSNVSPLRWNILERNRVAWLRCIMATTSLLKTVIDGTKETTKGQPVSSSRSGWRWRCV